MRICALTCSNGTVAIMQIVNPKAKIDAQIAKFESANGLTVVSHREISEADIPVRDEFRDSWTDDGVRIVPDVAKARGIAKRLLQEKGRPVNEQAIDAADMASLRSMVRG